MLANVGGQKSHFEHFTKMCGFQCDLFTLVQNVLWLVTQFWDIVHHLPPIPNPTHRKFLCLTKYFCMLCLATHFDTVWKKATGMSKRNQFKSAGGPWAYFLFHPERSSKRKIGVMWNVLVDIYEVLKPQELDVLFIDFLKWEKQNFKTCEEGFHTGHSQTFWRSRQILMPGPAWNLTSRPMERSDNVYNSFRRFTQPGWCRKKLIDSGIKFCMCRCKF